MRSLGKNPILQHSQRLKTVLHVLTCAKNASQRPQKMQIPRGYQKKSLLCRKSAILSIRWIFPFSEGWGGSLKKVLILVQRPQHKSTSDPVTAPKNNALGAIFIEFDDTKKCCTFSGLELVPKSRKKLIAALSCMRKGPKCIQTLWDHPKKIPFVQKYKEIATREILRDKTPFWSIPRG